MLRSKTIIKITLLTYPVNEQEIEDLIEHCLKSLKITYTLTSRKKTLFQNEEYAIIRKYFFIETSDTDGIFEFVKILDEHKETPLKNFEDIIATDFTIQCEEGKIKSEINSYINNKNEARNNILQSYTEEALLSLHERLERIEQRTAGLENYLSKSGLLHYRDFNEYMIDVLEQEDMIDADYARSVLFKIEH